MSKSKIFLVVLVILFVATVVGLVLVTSANRKTKTDITQNTDNSQTGILDIVKDPKYTNFTLQGKVTKISGDTITVDAGVVLDQKQTTITKNVIVDKNTVYSVQVAGKTTKASSADVKVGGTITIYTTVYPYDTQDSHPFLVVVQR